MIPRQLEPLYDMLSGIVKARNFIRYMSRDDFVADERTVFAVAHALSKTSRAAIRASYVRRNVERYTSVPWKTIRGVARRLTHFYQTIDPNVLWRTVKEDLPPIEEELRKILDIQEPEDGKNGYVRFIFDRTAVLTPEYLESVITPFIVALTNLQKLIDSTKGRTEHRIIVRAITYYSPVSVSFEGVAEATEVVRNTIVGWRREHSKKLADLIEKEKATEIEMRRAELLKIRAEAAKDRAESERIRAEAAVQLEGAKRQRLENERIRFELQRDKINFALELLKQIAPNLPEAEKITYVMKLLPILETFDASPLQMISEAN